LRRYNEEITIIATAMIRAFDTKGDGSLDAAELSAALTAGTKTPRCLNS
jgi:hypothetical protein